MSAPAAITIGVACEDQGHFSVVTSLVDAASIAAHDWLDGILEDCRSWRGVDEGTAWYKPDPEDARNLRPVTRNGVTVRTHGHIQGVPRKAEAAMWRAVLMLFCTVEPTPDVVVLARDMDGYERREGLDQVRNGIGWPFSIAFAAPEPETEAWLVSGFIPRDDTERAALSALRSELSFDPSTESHRLTSHPNDATTDAKRVLRRLTGDDAERRAACLTNRDVLRARGAKNGLARFLDEIEEHVVPVFGRRR
ncbi:MAG TPA: hypothetical protein PLR99_02610 [Polyangiaceae bacterium]|nr:hypothetical protein [Polyangiaceae bacterium]